MALLVSGCERAREVFTKENFWRVRIHDLAKKKRFWDQRGDLRKITILTWTPFWVLYRTWLKLIYILYILYEIKKIL